jgi:hypothetical protein
LKPSAPTPSYRLFVGVDIAARDFTAAHLVPGTTPKSEPKPFEQTASSFEGLQQRLRTFGLDTCLFKVLCLLPPQHHRARYLVLLFCLVEASKLTYCELTCSQLVPSLESSPKGIVPILIEDSPRFFLRCFLSDPLEPESQDAKTNQNHHHENKPYEHVRVYPPFLLLKACGEKFDLLLSSSFSCLEKKPLALTSIGASHLLRHQVHYFLDDKTRKYLHVNSQAK